MGYRIEIVVDDCMSSGKCVSEYPSAFDFDGDELATLINGGAELADDDMIKAARNCPSSAIQLVDDSGNRVAL